MTKTRLLEACVIYWSGDSEVCTVQSFDDEILREEAEHKKNARMIVCRWVRGGSLVDKASVLGNKDRNQRHSVHSSAKSNGIVL